MATTSRTDSHRLELLLQLGEALSTLDLRAALPRALEVLAEASQARTATITLLDEESGELKVAATHGAGRARLEKASYKVGEGIVGRVFQSGKPIVVPRISEEPLFLDRAGLLAGRKPGEGGELSFVCVPVAVQARAAGTLSLVVPHERHRDFDRDTTLLKVTASMVGQALKVARLVEAERRRLLDENQALRRELGQRYELANLVGTSPAMQQVYAAVAQAAPASTTVLIRGETGTGKELIAHAVHYASPRASGPFIKVNCGALPETLIDSELFGHEAGAFTDARKQKPGRFELADGGTLFLDEVGELSPATQVKLLRVLQERELERVGGVRPIKVDVRVIAATNRDLEAATRAGSFREDLYYRLDVFGIFVPPLRERRTDILLLADHFVEKYSAAHGKDVRRLATSAIDLLMAYHWPGNVRELENCIERAVLVCEGGAIHGHHLPPTLQTAELTGTSSATSLEEAVATLEKDLLQDALKSARGNRARAARLLQTTERIFNYKLRRYGLDPARFRVPGRPTES